eukprot:TRINITY_DN69571_c0_g1_i1.p1 TRINITY_DN69571_c0_g1~~TRINITY_DN69571_c0_g1_i1.p1  ORF type:complete len:421 (-),score=81.92 TRINITY_DN69571_c0_g1_i1:211-1392(-)
MAAAVGAAPRTVPMGKRVIDRPPHSRALQLSGDGHSIPAGGAVFPTAMYWATVQIGTPPQDFAVGIDSGSGDLFVEGKGCTGCTSDEPNNAYDSSMSSTSKKAFPGFFIHSYKTCNMVNPSATCIMSGVPYHDQVSIAGLGPVDVKLGAITRQSANFDTKKVIGGLMGMQNGEAGQDVFATLVAAGHCHNVWAMCMHEGSVSNGTLTVGGVDARLSDGTIEYVKDQSFGNHGVHVESVSFGGKKVDVGQNAVLDTGTNVLLLSKSLYADAEKAMCGDASLPHCEDLWATKCVALSEAEVDAYPPLTFQLDGIEIAMSSRDYLLLGSPLAESAGQYCLGIRDGGDAGFIIGATTMRNYYLVFDFAQKRIGWGKVNKEACGSLTSDDQVADDIAI